MRCFLVDGEAADRLAFADVVALGETDGEAETFLWRFEGEADAVGVGVGVGV